MNRQVAINKIEGLALQICKLNEQMVQLQKDLDADVVKLSKQCGDIIEHFDFVQVHKVMVALNWKWFMNDVSFNSHRKAMRVPTLPEVIDIASKDLWDFMLSGKDCHDTGGFYFTRNSRHGLEGAPYDEFKMMFVIEEKSA